MSGLECTLYEEKDSIAWITLNRPEVLNALNRKLWRELYENLNRAENSGNIRTVVITGAGRAFCAGDDIKEVFNLKTSEEFQTFFLNFAAPTIAKLVSMSKPVIAAVNGLAYGGGCEIAMLCDLVVASKNATFAVPEALIGAIPPVAAVIGAFVVGRLNASWMMLTGEPITAEEAKRIGLVNEVVPHEELLSTAEKMAKATMRAAPSSIKAIKRLTSLNFDQEKLKKAVEELINIVQTEEGREGHRAFMEKRLPKWASIEKQ
ncbi:enoyl-CoA hydratase/isomerase family protein [Candidatus Bathyarchaeota archaeon]|nr:enoyl-CoA hydratase/isomerase family protein [Candidatus Bathyarchaeota archaeon]